MKYLLDANVFIQASRFYYPMDIFPQFWEWIDEKNKTGDIYSITSIFEELQAGNDKLAQWAKDRKDTSWFFTIEDERTQNEFTKIANWLNKNTTLKPQAVPGFLKGADPWLIAKAMAEKYTVVTQEKSDPSVRRKVFIPDVCENFQVPCINTIKLIRVLKGRF